MSLDNFGNLIPDRPLTADIYWAAQHKVVRDAMIKIMGTPAAWLAGQQLAIQGFIIDPCIMCIGWEPRLTMAMRLSNRLAFTQSLNREPLPGRILSSINADDYPAVDQPIPLPPVNLDGLVDMIVIRDKDGNVVSSTPNLLWTARNGAGALTNYFAPGAGCYGPHGVAVVDGKSYVNPDDAETYIANVKQDVMGLFRVFMTQAA